MLTYADEWGRMERMLTYADVRQAEESKGVGRGEDSKRNRDGRGANSNGKAARG
jgi:hypothetical protein